MSNSGGEQLKVAFLTNIVSAYRGPVFQDLAATPGWQLRVLVNARTEFDRDWSGACDGVEVVQSRSLSFRRKRVSREPVRVEQLIEFHVPIGVWSDLRRFDPDVVITHELGPRSWVAAQYCRFHDKPMVLWSYQSRSSASIGGFVRRRVRSRILKSADAVIGMGIQAREVLEGFGVAPEQVIDAPNATDQSLITDRLAQSRASGRIDALRARYAQGRRVALVAGRLLPVKHIDGILEMWSSLPGVLRERWTLLFVGDGPLLPLIERVEDPSVQHAPGVPMREVADFYAISDLHVFASLADVWGLVVNESMLAGVPTLCSTLAGCADDLIEHGRNGLLFDPSDRASASAALRAALERPDLEELGATARATGLDYTPRRLADGFRLAVERALSRRGLRSGAVIAPAG